MAKSPTKPPGPPKGGSGNRPPPKKAPVNISPPVRTAAGVGLKTPTALTLAQRRSLAASEERHIEPRAAPKGEPKKPATSQKVKTEGGRELNDPKALKPKQVQSLAGSVMAHIPRTKPPTVSYPHLIAVEYTGDKMLSLDFGARQFAIAGNGLGELVAHLQTGTVLTITEHTNRIWPVVPSEGGCVSSILCAGQGVQA